MKNQNNTVKKFGKNICDIVTKAGTSIPGYAAMLHIAYSGMCAADSADKFVDTLISPGILEYTMLATLAMAAKNVYDRRQTEKKVYLAVKDTEDYYQNEVLVHKTTEES